LIPVSAGQSVFQLRPDAELAEFDAPHFLLQTEPRACAAAVMSFIQRSTMTAMAHDAVPDPPLNTEQALRVSRLTQEDLWEMDRVLLAQASQSWRKVARIVAMTIGELSERFPDVPDIYYAQRVRHLVEVGQLESQGNLAYMRYSEVRRPIG
jgi:hypothetical protein